MKTFLFAILVCGVSSSKIFEIVALTAAKQCYSCQEDCKNPTTENCQDADSKCYVTTVGSTLKEARGCINSTAAATFCDDQTESCYICDTELCNIGINKGITVSDLGVAKCYVCTDQCDKPVAQHNCQEVLVPAIEGKPEKAACLSFSIQKGTGLEVSKGCVPDNEAVRSSCFILDLSDEVSCSICDEELCNAVDDGGDNETSVNQCYFCENNCETPVPIQNCSDVLGEGVVAKCISIQASKENQTSAIRKCVEDGNEIRNYCEKINQTGGECSICDEELCNVWDDGDGGGGNETSVNQCYFCENNCQTPVPVQNCSDVLAEGAVAKCISIQTSKDNQTLVTRKCIEDGDQIRNTCEKINQTGGKCEICDMNLCNVWKPDDGGKGGSKQVYPLFCILFTATIFLHFV